MKLLLSYLLLSIALVACANDPSLNVSPNQTSFVVTLPANPTTGFQWSVIEFDKNLLTLDSKKFKKTKTDRMGAGGETNFTFLLQKNKNYPQSTKIKFKYARSWESNGEMTKTITVKFLKN